MKHSLSAIVFACSVGTTLIMGCAMRGHSYCVGNACFHRSDHPLDIYHSILLRNNPSYDKVIVTPQWQDYPIIDLYGTEVNLNDEDLIDSVTNNLNCICVGDKEFRLSVADKYVHLIMGESRGGIPGFLLTNADLKFPNCGSLVCCPYSALELSLVARQAGVSKGGTFVVYGKPDQRNDDMYDLIFDIFPCVNKVGRFMERYPFISFADNGNVDGNKKYFVGFDEASNPKDELFDTAIFRLDGNIIRCIQLPNKKSLSPNTVSRQSLIDSGFVKMINEVQKHREEEWRCGTTDDFVEATISGECVSRLRIETRILCKDDLLLALPIQEIDLKKIALPDYIERR